MISRRLLLLVALAVAATACDKSFLHKVKARQPATDATCAPDAPAENLAVEVFTDHVTLTWTSNAANEDGFIVERSEDGILFGELAPQPGPDATTFEDTNIQLGAVYLYKVTAFRSVNCLAAEAGPIEAVMFPATLRDITFGHPSDTSLSLDFDDPWNRRPTGYRVERTPAGSPSDTPVTATATPGQPYVDGGLTFHNAYHYRVFVLNVRGESSPFEDTIPVVRPPALDLDGPPYLGRGCVFHLHGTSTYDAAATPPCVFDEAAGVVSFCSNGSTATETGVTCTADSSLPTTATASWSVTDDCKASTALDLVLDVTVGTTTRGPAAVEPLTADPATPGRQAIAPNCGSCTGRRGGIALGDNHACMLTGDGKVSCWGANYDSGGYVNGQLGHGTPESVGHPVVVGSGASPTPWAAPLTGALALDQGYEHTCVVAADHSVRCWGYNLYGQLGDGTYANRGAPVAVCTADAGPDCPKLTGAKSVGLGADHTCAIADPNSTVWCWGDNGAGQLGGGDLTVAWTPVAHQVCKTGSAAGGDCVALTDVAELALAADQSCARMNDGKVLCWGGDTNSGYYAGGRGDGVCEASDCDPSTVKMVNPLQVCSASDATCRTGFAGATGVAAGGHFQCASDSSGRLWCWGTNDDGQLGVGSLADADQPRPVCAPGTGTSCAPWTGVVAVTTGSHHACAIAPPNDTAYCWGDNYYSQTGTDDSAVVSDVTKPTPVCLTGTNAAGTCTPLTQVASIAAGEYHACAVLTTGDVRCWGYNYWDQLGIGDTSPTVSESFRPLPVCLAGSAWNGTRCDDGASGDTRLSGATQVVAGQNHTCAVLTSGGLTCWGSNDSGQLGDNSTAYRYNPVTVTGLAGTGSLANVAAVALGSDHSCALIQPTGNPDGKIVCWGDAGDAAIGDNDSDPERLAPGDVCLTAGDFDAATGTCTSTSNLAGAIALAAGANHSCALLRTSGEVWCWGNNYSGQLGWGEIGTYGSGEAVPGPTCASGTGSSCPTLAATTIAAGAAATCAIAVGGQLRCWGDNSLGAGALGVVPSDRLATPAAVCATGVGPACVPLTTVERLTAGSGFACAALTDDSVHCWGKGGSGQLGNGATSNSGNPVVVGALSTPVTALAAGDTHVCAIVGAGNALECWGDNSDFRLGDCSISNSSTPVAVVGVGADCGSGSPPAISGVAAVDAGSGHTCAVMAAGGAVVCWGSDYYGQAGTNVLPDDRDDSRAPTEVCLTGTTAGGDCDPLVGASTVALGDGSSCALLSSGGEVRCWGYNGEGELGVSPPAWYVANPTAVCTSGAGGGCTALAGVVQVAAAANFSCAVLDDADKTARCWGDDYWGQLGTGSDYPNQIAPATVCATGVWDGITCAGGQPLKGITAISLGGTWYEDSYFVYSWAHTCALIQDGTMKCWGSNEFGQLGNGEKGTDGDGNPIYSLQPVSVLDGGPTLTNVVGITAGYYHTCAVLANGTARCWGKNEFGQLGDGSTTDAASPVAVAIGSDNGARILAVAAGGMHTCALLDDTTVQCWGFNADGEAGNGNAAMQSPTPSPVCAVGVGLTCEPLENVVAIAGSDYSSCAVLLNGQVRCWGWGDVGQTGDGSFGSSLIGIDGYARLNPVEVCATSPAPNCTTNFVCSAPLTGVVAIEGGYKHFCALTEDGGATCWGAGPESGQRGDGDALYIDDDAQCTPTTVCANDGSVCGTSGAQADADLQSCSVATVGVHP